MMLSLPKYDCYKDSGVSWLGDIPAHWAVTRIKFTCKYNQMTLDEKTDPNLVISYVDIGSVSQGKINKTETFTFRNAPSRARRKAKKGDTIISTVRTYLKAISYIDKHNSNNIFSTGFCILSPNKNIENKFFTYLLQSEYFISDIVRFSEGVSYPAITPLKLSNLKVSIPPLEEQERIVKFLDKKCEEVESAIALKQRLIELLEEQGAIVINQAVTKGLNPNAPMKDSGIDWLGDIPSHWEVKKLKYVSKYNQFTLDENTDPNLEISYIDIGSVSQGNINKTENYLFKNAPSRARRKSQEGDTIISTVRTYLKAISYVDKNYSNCIFSTGFCILTPNANIKNLFFTYWLQCDKFILEIIKNSEGVSYPAITPIKLSNINILIPPIEEQEEIVKYLEQKTAEIEELKEKTLQQIEKLKEFKQILIAEAVTGKIKV